MCHMSESQMDPPEWYATSPYHCDGHEEIVFAIPGVANSPQIRFIPATSSNSGIIVTLSKCNYIFYIIYVLLGFQYALFSFL